MYNTGIILQDIDICILFFYCLALYLHRMYIYKVKLFRFLKMSIADAKFRGFARLCISEIDISKNY